MTASPLTPLHITGVDNSLTNIPSRSFGPDPKWHCDTHDKFLTFYNTLFPLENQASWTIYHPSSSAIITRVISTLPMMLCTMDEKGVTSNGWQKYWNHWITYVAPLGVDPFLQATHY